MKRIVKRFAEHIIDLAGELGIQADTLTDANPDIATAEPALHLRDALRYLKAARMRRRWRSRQLGDSVLSNE